jgi:hypothetical protein
VRLRRSTRFAIQNRPQPKFFRCVHSGTRKSCTTAVPGYIPEGKHSLVRIRALLRLPADLSPCLRLVPRLGLIPGGLLAAMVSYLRLYTPRQRQATLTLVSATATGRATRCRLASSKGAFGLPRSGHAAGEALLAYASRQMWSLWMVGRWLPFQLAFWGKALTGNRLWA